MPVRLTRPYQGQAVNTLYWGPDEATLRATGGADDNLEAASDYGSAGTRIITNATGITTRNALVYRMNSGSAQTLTLEGSGYWVPGTVVTVIQEGAGATTITPATGVTVNTSLGGLKTQGQWTVAQLIKRGADLWVAVGGLGA